MRGTLSDGLLEIAAHAHAKACQVIAPGDFGEKGKVEAGGFVERGDTHETLERQAQISAFGNQRIDVFNGAPGFLLLVAGVHLNEEVRAGAGFFRNPRDAAGEFRAIHGVDSVEEVHCGAGLVGLQGANQMEFNAVEARLNVGPFALRFLNAVFAEDAVALLKHGLNPVEGLNLADGDQVDVLGVAAMRCGGVGDAGLDGFKAHGLVLTLAPKKKRAGSKARSSCFQS